MSSRSLRAALFGALAVVVAWLAVTLPLAQRDRRIDPVAAPTDLAVAPPADDPSRPTAVVLLSQAGTEVTDFLAPFAILAASGHFNVYAVAPDAAPAPTNGGLGIVPHLTLAQFDAAHPNGAGLVVIPNVLDPDNPALIAWITAQAGRGAVTASICEGARLLARTGLLDAHAATTHFAALGELRSAHPSTRWRDDARWVDDGAVVTSAGVTAAVDAALHLVARFAGAPAAARTAAALALPAPTDAAAAPARLTVGPVMAGVLNGAFVWPKQAVAVPLTDGVDEIGVAAQLDAYWRTFATRTTSTTPNRRPVRSRHGLTLVPMHAAADAAAGTALPPPAAGVFAFDQVLRDIAARFGSATAALVALQLQYPATHLGLDASPTFPPRTLATLAALLAAGAGLGVASHRWRRKPRPPHPEQARQPPS